MKLTPFLLFDGVCDEAMAFYQSCLGGELTLTRISDTPMKGQMPPEHHGKVAFACLKSETVEFSGADWLHPSRIPKQGNTVCMFVNSGNHNELRAIFERLSVGGDKALLDDLREMPFGLYGHLADRFGVHWFFQGEKKDEVKSIV